MKPVWTLSRKIGLLAMVVSSLVVLIASLLSAFAQYKSAMEQMDQQLNVLSKVTAFNIASSSMFADERAATNVLKALSVDSSIISARLMTANRNKLASYHRGSAGVAGSIKNLATEVLWLEEPVGNLYLEVDTSALREKLYRQIELTLAMALVALFVIGFFVQWFTNVMTLPLRKLSEVADQVGAKNDYGARAPITDGRDEVYQLAFSFNTMLDRIQLQDVELRRQQQVLAQEVVDRTSALREKTALLLEVHHRVKNNLQVITSLLRMETSRSEHQPTKAVLKDMQGRIRSMALLHETIYRKGTFAAIDLGSYIGQIASESLKTLLIGAGTVSLRLDFGAVQVGLDQATPCGMLVTELLANCLKHGFPEGRTGEISISLALLKKTNIWRLRVSDNGIGLPADFEARRQRSLGLQLVGDLAAQMSGALHIESGSRAVFTVDFTVDEPKPLVITLGGLAP
ncbi:histidine kinase dimerization/phosphoacceptor domain -containing protein [Roseateles oligotrophus]|uniref:histidine kinase n=1 Tax=Roseateles oligotrophus TaxID=1769250 RepID=A0ABT2Y8Z0_9BURK|nr:histidine kinase dimerization/phosphoacceptor domain -containing protein [Roseateles oligotrophus]MCV2366529.1 HAMP domain-containing protein [Roseateles oligotrophus]